MAATRVRAHLRERDRAAEVAQNTRGAQRQGQLQQPGCVGIGRVCVRMSAVLDGAGGATPGGAPGRSHAPGAHARARNRTGPSPGPLAPPSARVGRVDGKVVLLDQEAHGARLQQRRRRVVGRHASDGRRALAGGRAAGPRRCGGLMWLRLRTPGFYFPILQAWQGRQGSYGGRRESVADYRDHVGNNMQRWCIVSTTDHNTFAE